MHYIHRIYIILLFTLIWASHTMAQCPSITSSGTSPALPGSFCTGETITFSVAGEDFDPGTIDFFLDANSGFNPYAGEGTFIGSAQTITEACLNQIEVLYIMVNPDNVQVGSPGDRCDEFIVLWTGSGGFDVNEITISNIGIGDVWDSFVPGNVNTFTPSCGTALGPNDEVPENAILIIQSGPNNNVTVNITELCNAGLPVYIISAPAPPDCEFGYFDNNNSNGCSSCPVMIDIAGECTYDLDYFYVPPTNSTNGWGESNLGGGAVYDNVVPPVTVPIFDPGVLEIEDFEWQIPDDFCETNGVGPHYVTGIANPAPSGVCAEIFNEEFEINITCPSAILMGGGDLCVGNCPDNPGQLIFGFSGGQEPYVVDLVIGSDLFPDFNIPGIALNVGDKINLCVDGLFPSYDIDEMTLQIPTLLQGLSFTVTLLSITDNAGCTGIVQLPGSVTLNVVNGATSNANGDYETCGDAPVNLNGSFGGSGSSGMWITNGDGTFDDPSLNNAVYTPGPNDVQNNEVGLFFIAFSSNGACEPDTSVATLFIYEPLTITAFTDTTLCSNGEVLLSTLGQGDISTYSWSTSGDGSFTNPSSSDGSYLPGPGDVALGSVQLTVTANDFVGICPEVSSSIDIIIQPEISVNIPMTATICSDETYELTALISGIFNDVLWATSGDGTFSSLNSSETTYTPGIADTTNGLVMIMITVFDQTDVCPSANAVLELSIQNCDCPGVIIDPGPYSLCSENSTLNLISIITTNESGSWSISSAPSGGSPATVVADEFVAVNADPGMYEIAFTLDNPQGGCPNAFLFYITVFGQPSGQIISQTTFCEGDMIVLTTNINDFVTEVNWQSNGTGSFSNEIGENTEFLADSIDFVNGFVQIVALFSTSSTVCSDGSDTITLSLIQEPFAEFDPDPISVCNDSTFGSIVNFPAAILAGDATGMWMNMSGAMVDLSDPTQVNFSEIPIGTYPFIYTTNAGMGVCSEVSYNVFVQVRSCTCPDINLSPLPGGLCNSDSIMNLAAFLQSSAPGSWSITGEPGGAQPAFLIGSEVHIRDADPGNYEVTFTLDAAPIDGCPDSAVVSFFIQDQPGVLLAPDSIAICSDQVLALNPIFLGSANGGQWTTLGDGSFFNDGVDDFYDPGSNDVINQMVLLFSTTTDTFGFCSPGQDTLHLTIDPKPFAQLSHLADTLCSDPDSTALFDFASLIIGGDTNGIWSDIDGANVDLSTINSVDFDNIANGSYTFQYETQIADSTCPDTFYLFKIVIENCACPRVEILNPLSLVCDNEILDLNTTINTSVPGTWSIISFPVGNSPGTLSESVFDANSADPGIYSMIYQLNDSIAGCPASFLTTVEVTSLPLIQVLNVECEPGLTSYAATVESSRGLVSISVGDIVFLPDSSFIVSNIPITDTLFITIQSTNPACSSDLTIPPPDCSCQLTIQQLPMQVEFCTGGSESLTVVTTGAVGDIDAFWNTPANDTIRGLMILLNEEGIYQFSITDEMGCSLTEFVEVNHYPSFQFKLSHEDESCAGFSNGTISLDTIIGVGTYTVAYNFNPAIPVSSFPQVFSDLPVDDYSIVFTDENGCLADTLLMLKPGAENVIDLGLDLVISPGDSVLLDPSFNFTPVSWIYEPMFLPDSILTGFIRPNETVLIQLIAADSLGCSANDELLISIESSDDIFIPNIFSPNGDSNNDFFFIQSRDLVPISSFQIFDRWGTLVFEQNNFISNDPSSGWDGKMNGNSVMPGVYVFRIVYESGNQMKEQRGDLLLIK